MYEAKVARWLTIDPAGEFWSPYVAMGNNPVGNVDPDGGSISPIFDKETGEFITVDWDRHYGAYYWQSKYPNFNKVTKGYYSDWKYMSELYKPYYQGAALK